MLAESKEQGPKSSNSTPSFSEFSPAWIPYQARVVDDLWNQFDYEQGLHEILMSGSVGSAKSILMAHIAVRHCLENVGARVLLGRKTMPALKQTIFSKTLEHLDGSFVRDVDYYVNETQASIYFPATGSEIVSWSWSDRQYKKIRSLELSGAVIEELTENDEEDEQAYDEIKMRVGRLPHIKQNFMISATNPDSPGHWVYRRFFEEPADTKHIYFSVTTDNPFLPAKYIEQLRRDLDPKLARRMIYGEWIDIAEEVVYHAYDPAVNFRKEPYKVNPALPIHLSWDFNIGDGKPLSVVLFQYDPVKDYFHVFAEVVVEGMRTESSCEELAARGLLDHLTTYVVNGDASGKNRDTRNIKSDYDIIKGYLSNYRTPAGQPLRFEMDVPLANPAVRLRHNRVNAYFTNDIGLHRCFVYQGAPTADKGFRSTQLKKGGMFVEDDSKAWQHITTAFGYGLIATLKTVNRPEQGTRRF